MEIKICGITNLAEIEYINILKPNYIGFVFSKSIRRISKEKAKFLKEKINNDIKVVAVFKNEKINYVIEVSKYINADIIQLHGIEDMNYIKNLISILGSDISIWKAISVVNSSSLKEINKYKVSRILLDSKNPGKGETFNLNYLKDFKGNEKILIAGGINKRNIKEVIEKVNPLGVDISSGVEEVNLNGERYKSFEKMKDLIMEVREYDKRKI